MKPRRLIIEGFNSFEEKQEIDFSKLTDRGLFGIFGPTGSGKSTILDAIIFSLYGKVPRGAGNEYINSASKSAHILYEFEIGNGSKRRILTSDKCVRKNKDGTYRYSYAKLYEHKDGGDIIIAESTNSIAAEIIKIIGLNETDFMRSVVLPQGKFSEFLMLAGEARRNMLERIFSLERFGQKLMDRIKKMKYAYDDELNILSGELKGFQEISEDGLKAEKEALEELKAEEVKLKNEKRKLDKEYERCKNLWEIQNELEIFISKEENLKIRYEAFENKKNILKNGRAAVNVKPLIDNAEDTQNKINNSDKNTELINKSMNEINDKLNSVREIYNKAFEAKEKDNPQLIKYEADYRRAADIQRTNAELMKEKDKLLAEYRKEEAELKKIRLSILSTDEKREKLLSEINIREKTILEKTVSLEYRDRVQSASKKEEEFRLLEKTRKALEEKIKGKEITIQSESTEYEVLKSRVQILEEKINNINNQLAELDNQNLGDSNILLSRQDLLNKVRDRYKELKINTEKLKSAELQMQEVNIKKAELLKKIQSIKDNASMKDKLFQGICSQIEKLEINSRAAFLAKSLKEGEPCPVCGSIHHPDIINEQTEDIAGKLQQKQKLEKDISELNITLNKYNINYAEISKEEEHINTMLQEIRSIIRDDDIRNMEESKLKLEAEFNKLLEDTKEWKEKKAAFTAELGRFIEEKSISDKAEAKLEEGMAKENEALSGYRKEYNETLIKYDEVLNEYNSLKKELKSEDISEELKKIRNNEIIVDRCMKENSVMRKNIDELNKERENLAGSSNRIEKNISEILTSGREKASVIEKNKEEIKALCGDGQPEDLIKEVREKIAEINKTEESLRIQLEEISTKQQKLLQEKASEIKNRETLIGILDETKQKLELALKENNFNNVDEVYTYLNYKDELKTLSDEIDEYNKECDNVKSNIQRLNNKTKGEKVDSDYFENLKNKKDSAEQELNLKNGEIAVKSENITKITVQLEKYKVLIDKKTALEHKISLLMEILNLTKGNAFVEYVARNQLSYIIEEASSRLKSITNERYALLIDDDFKFNIRDDFNGGYVRPVNTMSGGEIFLASLCLALALSSQIQLKGNVPLEFFFLDEGFGTLDSELLDTVMSSLEKLHSEKLSVGIISHVEEIKNRVPVKLIVEPAVSGIKGTNVKVEYT